MKDCMRKLKKTLAVILCLCVATWPAASAEDNAGHTHGTALTADRVTIGATGTYYLGEDICLQQTLKISGDGVEVKLCLNGHSLTAASGTYVIEVGSGASLSILDCYTPETHGTLTHEYWYSYYDSSLSDPADGYWKDTAEGGCILGYTSAGNTRQGVNVNGGSVTMYGGTIAGCKSSTRGGGVYVRNNGSFTMYGGAIEHNYAKSTGGGICVYQGSVIICSGHVESNTAIQAGGGVYVMPYCSLYMEGGNIDGNIQGTASSMDSYGGGGVYLMAYASFELAGGSISGNSSNTGGGGVYVAPLAELRLSGDVTISGNRKGEQADNVSLYHKQNSAPGVVLSGALAETAEIGLNDTKETLDDPITVVTADSGYCSEVSAADFSRFSSDDSTRSLFLQDGKIQLRTGRAHAVCGAACDHEIAHEQAVFLPMDESFTGGALASGSYYLTKDIALTEPILVSGEGTIVNLCLEGRELQNKSGYVIQVTKGAKLNLCDCYDAATHPGEEYAHSSTNPYIFTTTSFYGGALNGNTGHTAVSGGVRVDGGEMYLFGGVIGGASQNGGVNVINGGTFEMYGGSVIQCYKKGNGGGIYADKNSNFRMYGGTVANNYAGQYGGGIYAEDGFTLSGETYITGNTARTFTTASNIYVPNGKYISVTGTVIGQMGVTMERDGVFTTGGGAESRSAFQADAPNGVYVEAVNGELAIEKYGVAIQPTAKSVTVTMKSPEHVASYQWYEMMPGEPKTLTGAMTGEYWDVDSFDLKNGDTLRVTELPDGASGVSLMRLVENADGESVPETAASDYEPEDGAYCVAAPAEGKYILRILFTADGPNGTDGSVTVQKFAIGNAAAGQTLPSYTGREGWRLCKATYDDNVTVIYSDPVWAADHRHEGSTDVYTPLTGDGSGGLRIGDGGFNASTELEAGKYFLPADLTLEEPLTITGGTVELCLNEHMLKNNNGSAIIVESDAELVICTCGDGANSILSGGAENGGGIDSAGNLTLRNITLKDCVASGCGGGIYAAGGEVLLDHCVFSGCSAGDNGGGVYLEGTAVIDGGSYTGGSADGKGGGIYVTGSGELTLAGTVTIYENFCTDGTPANLYLEKNSEGIVRIALTEDFSGSKIGVGAETVGVFTSGATEDALEQFSVDEKGFHLSQYSDSELAISAYAITKQPTSSSNTVEVNWPQEASFQWYTATAETVSDESDSRYDAETKLWNPDEKGECFTLFFTKGQTIIITPQNELNEDTAVLWNGVALEAKNGAFTVYISQDDQYTLSLMLPESTGDASKFSAVVYTVGGVVSGATEATISAGAGTYICLVKWPDGTELWSDFLTIERKDSTSTLPEVPISVWPVFEDVPEDAWYSEDVRFAYETGIMEGTAKALFSPNAELTRGMAATLLWRMAGRSETKQETTFEDVEKGQYYYKAVCWAQEVGAILGINNLRFAPGEPVTREQFAAMLYRYAGRPETDGDLDAFCDANDVSDYAHPALIWAVEERIVYGKGNKTLDPCGHATRAEVAAILRRYLGIVDAEKETGT